jgi:DNA-binding transcriptional LysR family regulator
VPLEALADETFVVPSREKEPGYHEQLVGACERAGFYPKAGHEVTELQVGLGLIAAGVGVTLVPSSVRNLKTTGVAYRRLRGHAPKMELSVVRRREEPSCVLRDLLDVSEEFVHRSVARN